AGRADRPHARHALAIRAAREHPLPRDRPAGRPLTAGDTQPRMHIALPYETIRLDNGLRVFVHEHRATPLVSVNLWYHVGSANERPGRTGFAHLFEHLMFEGSKHVRTGEFDNLLESLGAANNG